eukprot:TRINITY_DN15932_c0_g1_i1.p1 TRINITY_DN15932_c0_g1~~TRINITY_DN15932_c0_g1_i1.p1  ORF type:complete len:197 (+),score=42.89 TRINITY_DN15932_c0_g1_i1:84-593(+)
MHSSSALQTHGIWTNTIGYDPYAPDKNIDPQFSSPNAFDNFQGLMALARMTGSVSSSVRSSCRKCNGVGHLTHQCRNTIRPESDSDDSTSSGSDTEYDNKQNGQERKPGGLENGQEQNRKRKSTEKKEKREKNESSDSDRSKRDKHEIKKSKKHAKKDKKDKHKKKKKK